MQLTSHLEFFSYYHLLSQLISLLERVDFVDARYVKVEIGDGDCLQIGEFEVYGWK